jgi:hypothetical protein
MMSTTEQEKPAAKPRSRSRKGDQRNPKGRSKAQASLEQARPEPDPISAMVAPPVENAPVVESAPVEAEPMVAATQEAVIQEAVIQEAVIQEAPAAAVQETASEPALSGEVLLPEVRVPAPQVAGLPAIALAYAEYTRKSWVAGRSLFERLITARSLDEAIEIQGEFAKQACVNFVVQSQKICVLYGELAQQFFRPVEKFTADWSRAGR